MRIGIKRIFPAKRNHNTHDILQQRTIIKKPLNLIPTGFQTNALELNKNKIMIELELERKQSSAQVYVNMIPPR